ncbi:ABC transporter permease [Streptomyces sp. 8N616]|uniref:ABC transporter permease n=1 Tax=Streptomyces sp. 8N616 TaxID=3457414 RepID=UPI003FD086BE
MAPTEPDHLSAPTSVRLVASRELRTRLRSAGFIAGTLLTMAIVAILALLPSFFGGDDGKSVAVVGLSTRQKAALTAHGTAGEQVEIREAGSVARARSLLDAEDVDGMAVVNGSDVTITVRQSSDRALADWLTARLERQAFTDELRRQGADVEALAVHSQVHFTTTDSGDEQRVVLAYVVSLMLFSQIVGSGGSVAQGVVEEKSTRVIEILLAKVRPTPLLIGKVLGIGAVGLIQLLAVAAAGVVTASVSGALAIESTILQVAGASLAWYLLGFLFYGFVYGAVGSMVSRQEELAGLTIPLQLVNTTALVIAVIGLQDIGAGWLAAFSYIPPFSAILVPLRMAGGVASPAEIVLPAVILLAVTAFVVWLGGVIYNRSILHTGKRMKITQILQNA